MPSVISAYFMSIPIKLDSHIQKNAPGPPNIRADETPTILPVPTAAERAVVAAWKDENELLSVFFCITAFLISEKDFKSPENCKNRDLKLKYRPIKISKEKGKNPEIIFSSKVKNFAIKSPNYIDIRNSKKYVNTQYLLLRIVVK